MKRIVFLICFFGVFSSVGQKGKKINWTEWTDSTAFYQGKAPLVAGYGQFSDSLSRTYDGKTFFEANGIYYVINSAADYYLWFTSKYPYLFDESIETYRFFYLEGDRYNMLRYIEFNYTGARRPLKFVKTHQYYSPNMSLEKRLSLSRDNQLFENKSGYGPPTKTPPKPTKNQNIPEKSSAKN
ncbi:MAG: hypothetical protein AAF391_01185 [Bacteroidota bacterium]